MQDSHLEGLWYATCFSDKYCLGSMIFATNLTIDKHTAVLFICLGKCFLEYYRMNLRKLFLSSVWDDFILSSKDHCQRFNKLFIFKGKISDKRYVVTKYKFETAYPLLEAIYVRTKLYGPSNLLFLFIFFSSKQWRTCIFVTLQDLGLESFSKGSGCKYFIFCGHTVSCRCSDLPL